MGGSRSWQATTMSEREWSRSPSPLKMASMSQIMADADKDSAPAGGGTTPGRQLTRAEKMEQKRKTAKGDALELPGFSLDAFAMASSQPSAVFAQQTTSTTAAAAALNNPPTSKQSRRRSSRGDSPKQPRESDNVNKQQTTGHESTSKQSPATRPKPTPRTKQKLRKSVQDEDEEPPMLDANIPRKVARRSSGTAAASKIQDSAAQSPAKSQNQPNDPPSALRMQPRSQDKGKSPAAPLNGTSASAQKAPKNSARSSSGRSTFGVAYELVDDGGDAEDRQEDQSEAGPSQSHSPEPPAPSKPAALSRKSTGKNATRQPSEDSEADASDDQASQSRSRAASNKKQARAKGSKKRASNENESEHGLSANKRRKGDKDSQTAKKGKAAAQQKGKQKATPVEDEADAAQSQEEDEAQLEPEPQPPSDDDDDDDAPEPAPTKRTQAKATSATTKEKHAKEPKKKASAKPQKDSNPEPKKTKNAKGKGKAASHESEIGGEEDSAPSQSQAQSKKRKQPRGKEKDGSVPPGFGSDAKEAVVPSGTTRFLSLIEPHFDDAAKTGLPDDVAGNPQVSKVFKRLIKAWKKGVTDRVKELRLSVATDAKSETHTKLANDLRRRQLHVEQIARDQEAEEGFWEDSRSKKRLTHRLHEYAVNLESSAQDASGKQDLGAEPDTYDLESSLRIFESFAAPQQTVSAHKSHGGDATFGANPDLDGTTFNDRLQRWNELFQMKLDKADEEAETDGASE